MAEEQVKPINCPRCGELPMVDTVKGAGWNSTYISARVFHGCNPGGVYMSTDLKANEQGTKKSTTADALRDYLVNIWNKMQGSGEE